MTDYFPPKIWNKARNVLSPFLFNILLEALASEISQEKGIKYIHITKEEIKASLSADDIFVYIENFKEFTKNLFKNATPTTNKWIYQGHRIQYKCTKSISFLYIKNELVETEIKNTVTHLL